MSATATVITAPYVSFFASDWSSRVKTATFNFNIDEVETTTGGDGIHIMLPGLEGASVTLNLSWNSTIDSDLWTNKGTTGTIIVGHSTTAASASLPRYSFTGFANSWPLVAAEVGAEFETEVAISISGAITRVTS